MAVFYISAVVLLLYKMNEGDVNMKNVAIIIQQMHGGGAERIAGLLSKELTKKYNVYLFLMDVSNKVYDYGGTIIDLSQNCEGADELPAGINFEAVMRKNKEKYNIDCSISFLETANIMNIRTKGKDSVIISQRNSMGEIEPFPLVDGIKIKTWYNYADRIVSVAYGTHYDLVKYFGIKDELITTIYNFIDKEKIFERFNAPVDDETISFVGDSKVILNVGRLMPQKNQKKLLVQFAKLIEDNYDVKLIIVGEGYLEHELRQLARDLRIDRFVRFVTFNKDPFPYYRIASVMVLTSDYEGLPNVLLEALLLGVPVVGVDCLSGPKELLKETADYSTPTRRYEICHNGILVECAKTDETGETEYLKEAIELMLDDKSLSQSVVHNGKKFMERYKNEEILEQWVRLIEETSSEKRTIPSVSIPGVDKAKKIIVYGAGLYGKITMQQFLQKKDQFDLLCFAVSDKSKNPSSVCGIPVYEIGELVEQKEDSLVIIGVPDRYADDVIGRLEKEGFKYAYSSI